MIRNMIFTNGRLQQGLRVLFAVYLIFTFYITVVSRASSGRDLIRTEWFEDYKSVHDVYANSEIYLNNLLFVPSKRPNLGPGLIWLR